MKHKEDSRGCISMPRIMFRDRFLSRLVYTVKEFRRRNHSVDAYLVVMNEFVASKIPAWIAKYEAEGLVTVKVAPLTTESNKQLNSEKQNNVAAMVAGTVGSGSTVGADASIGRDLGEQTLFDTIKQNHPHAKQVTDSSRNPFGVRWDYYGVEE